MTADTYLRRGRRRLQGWMEDPGISNGVWAAGCGLGGFLLSAASIRQTFQPIAMGVLCAMSGWQILPMGLGSMVGYRLFWGQAGIQGVLWSAAGAIGAGVLGRRKKSGRHGLMTALLAAALVAGGGVIGQVVWKQDTAFFTYVLQIVVAAASAALADQVLYHRDVIADWLAGGVLVLALAQLMPLPYLGLGYVAAGWLGVTGPFPAAALAGLGLDLAQVTAVPMTAVMCGGYLLRMIPFSDRRLRCGTPGAAGLVVMLFCGLRDPAVLPGLILGGGLGLLLPQKPGTAVHRGPTGVAQVRLELSAGVMSRMQQILQEQSEPAVDAEALVQKARSRACSSCIYRKTCQVQRRLRGSLLQNPLAVSCRKTGRLMAELRRSQDQLRVMRSEQHRREEFRRAVIQQYWFLSRYLRSLADQMPRRAEPLRASFTVEVSARSHRKEQANGDQCIAFPGVGCRYYVLLCDGMGTGLGAAAEGKNAADLIREILTSGLPSEYALQSINSLLILRGQAGAVTVDLAELRLDTGRAFLYKWGAAPSWLLKDGKAKKIGTATPPPGISVTETREAVMRLSLCRGEVLILFSDGVDGEKALRRVEWTPDASPGELAEKLLEDGCGETEDDATAAVLRLRPASLVT